MSRPDTGARSRLLEAASRQLRKVGAGRITLDGLAREAGCAKGLVVYHFETREKLIAAAAEEILRDREEQWRRAFRAESLDVAVRQTWQLIQAESRDGLWRAWLSPSGGTDRFIVQTVNNYAARFAALVTDRVAALLRAIDLESTIPAPEFGQMLAAGLQGVGFQLALGGRLEAVEAAHSALWAAALGLTRPTR